MPLEKSYMERYHVEPDTGRPMIVKDTTANEHVPLICIALPESKSIAIANGESESGEIDVRFFRIFSLSVPSGTEGSHIQIRHVPTSGGSSENAKDDGGNLLIVPFTAGETVILPAEVAALHYITLKSCSAADGTAQAQTGAATLTLKCKG